nr:LptA/OstA family protein [Oceanicola sp. S124]
MIRAQTRPFSPRSLAPLAFVAGLLALLALPAAAQQTSVPFGTETDSSAPIQVQSDTLSVSQEDGSAVFEGNVLVEQDSMRMEAARVQVIYDEDQSRIQRLEATGGVTLVSGEDAAEAERADYDVDDGNVVMSGDVLLVRGPSTIQAERMRINLDAGTALMEGRVRTFLTQDGN